jgi:sensor histidine kinase YesM
MDSSIQTLFNRRYGFWFFQFAGWGLFIIYDFLTNILPGERLSLLYIFYWLINITYAFVITLLMRLVYKSIYDRFKIGGQAVIRIITSLIVIIIITSVVSAVLWVVFQHFLAMQKVFDYSSFFNDTMEFSVRRFYSSAAWLLWPFFTWSILYFLIKSRHDYLNEKERAEKAMVLTTEAQLKSLRYQINPHFLFNTLISIQGLMYHNTKLADKMLTELSEFLRYTLRYNQLVFVPLEDEIEIIEKYLTIQKIRFGEKLKYSFSIASDTKKIQILCFLLQPLVENAIFHGMKESRNGVQIWITMKSEHNNLKLEIINTGKYDPDKYRVGTGLDNVRQRLENAYPDHHGFEIIQVEDRVHVTIKIKLEK